MKFLLALSLSLLVTVFLSSSVQAAKANHDRSKPNKMQMDKECLKDKDSCKKNMKEKHRKKAKSKATDYNSSRSNKSEKSKKMTDGNSSVSKTKAQDYNSSRSNTTAVANDMSDSKGKKKKAMKKMNKELCDKAKDKNCKTK